MFESRKRRPGRAVTARRRGVALLAALAIAVTPALTGCGGSEGSKQAGKESATDRPGGRGAATDDPTAKASDLPFENTTKGAKDDTGARREVFADDFEGDALDPRKWRTREQPAFGRRLCATPDQAMVRVRDGQAVLGIARSGKASKTCPHGVFKNAMIGTGEVTEPGFDATHGLFAARLKFQSGRGQHGAFWLQGSGPGALEIDIAEYFGDGRPDGGLTTLVHRTADDGTLTTVGGPRLKVPTILGEGNTPSNGWHVWSVEWSPKGYVFRVDDTATLRTKRNLATAPEFIVLSLLTSDWELPALDTTTSTMNVDWVRVWQRRSVS